MTSPVPDLWNPYFLFFATKVGVRCDFCEKSASMLWFSQQTGMLWFLRHKCICCEFCDENARMLWFLRRKYICCELWDKNAHNSNCVFGISVSNFSVSQVFGAHTCTIYRHLPTKIASKIVKSNLNLRGFRGLWYSAWSYFMIHISMICQLFGNGQTDEQADKQIDS